MSVPGEAQLPNCTDEQGLDLGDEVHLCACQMTRHGGGSPDGWLRRFRSWVRVARCRRCGGGEVRRAERMNADAYASRANSRGIRGSAPAVDRGAGQWTWLDGNDGDGGGGAWWWWWMAWGEPDSGSGSGSGNGNGGAGVDGWGCGRDGSTEPAAKAR